MVTTTTRRLPSTLLLEPGAPQWAQRLLPRLTEFFRLRHPQAPSELMITTVAELPPAEEWLGAEVWLRDLGKVAVSNGTAWVKTDGGAL